MGQKSLKSNRRALSRYAKKEKNSIVNRYMTDNWDKVLVSSVALIRSFGLKSRFSIAMTILFKPIKKKQAPKDGNQGATPTAPPQNRQAAEARA